MNYLYPHFKRQSMIEDSSFHSGPQPGDPMPDFNLLTTDGQHVRKEDFVGERPLLLTMGSIT